jgi:hypothetical protein
MKLGKNRVIDVVSKDFHWRTSEWFVLIPSIGIEGLVNGKGVTNNMETRRRQKYHNIDIFFTFLYFTASIEFIYLWGDEGCLKLED